MKNLIASPFARVSGAAALLLACGAAGLAAAATPVDQVPSVVVRYGDLNLQSDDGLLALHRRLSAAASKVCPKPSSNLDLAGLTLARSCQSAAIARAMRSLHDPHLVELMTTRFKAG
jgi:UrcA family protein